MCDSPGALVGLLDAAGYECEVGRDGRVSRSQAMLSPGMRAACTSLEPLVARDTLLDERFRNDPFVLREPGIRFIACVPIVGPSGTRLGSVFAIDRVSHDLLDDHVDALRAVGRMFGSTLERRRGSQHAVDRDAGVRVAINVTEGVLILETPRVQEDAPRCVFVNESFSRLTGVPAGEIVGKSSDRMWRDTDRCTVHAMRRRLQGDAPFVATLEFFPPAGANSGLGKPSHWIALLRDVSERSPPRANGRTRTRWRSRCNCSLARSRGAAMSKKSCASSPITTSHVVHRLKTISALRTRRTRVPTYTGSRFSATRAAMKSAISRESVT